jgi:hypothetical protein
MRAIHKVILGIFIFILLSIFIAIILTTNKPNDLENLTNGEDIEQEEKWIPFEATTYGCDEAFNQVEIDLVGLMPKYTEIKTSNDLLCNTSGNRVDFNSDDIHIVYIPFTESKFAPYISIDEIDTVNMGSIYVVSEDEQTHLYISNVKFLEPTYTKPFEIDDENQRLYFGEISPRERLLCEGNITLCNKFVINLEIFRNMIDATNTEEEFNSEIEETESIEKKPIFGACPNYGTEDVESYKHVTLTGSQRIIKFRGELVTTEPINNKQAIWVKTPETRYGLWSIPSKQFDNQHGACVDLILKDDGFGHTDVLEIVYQ